MYRHRCQLKNYFINESSASSLSCGTIKMRLCEFIESAKLHINSQVNNQVVVL